jgi:hypothetical protein
MVSTVLLSFFVDGIDLAM